MKETSIAVLAAEFNRDLINAMVAAARDEAKTVGGNIVYESRVPGCYETVLIADELLRRKDVEILVVLGFIERGETLHGEVMGHVVHRALIDLGLQYRKPIGIGIIGPGATDEQARSRQDSYARDAVRAAVKSHKLIASLGSVDPE